jgi:hypothetical protein
MGPPIANYESWPLKVLYAPDGVKLETALTHLDTAVANIPATRWPDIVHVCGQYVIVKIDSDGKFKRSDGTPLLANTFFAQSVRPDAWAFMQVVLRVQSIEQHMRMMLFSHDQMINKLPTT